MYQEKQMLN